MRNYEHPLLRTRHFWLQGITAENKMKTESSVADPKFFDPDPVKKLIVSELKKAN